MPPKTLFRMGLSFLLFALATYFLADWSGDPQSIEFAQLFCIFFGGTGLALVVIGTSRVVHDAFSLAAAPRMFPDMALRNFMPFVKHRPLPVFQALPHWGIFSSAILWILVIIFMMFRPQTPRGLYVSLSSPEIVVPNSPAQETLGVYVGPGGHFFVNGEEVQRAGLRAKLLEHLTRSVSWTVYFEANANTVYMDDIYAIDTIQGCGAKLIWITPRMREEWKRKEQSLKHIP
jgi:biopolymer transport protein ExbD